ncbi:MFS transporter [Xanthobacter autotrophicus]|uniref:MFS transporter n=1 Tax=Xanthobacter TaxID=279 RepID=UPI0024AC6BB0|nr:MFS transporter [Xanthobacter autotrophicus]MDI4665594.1 MFS transporter [Xanthobacter autotrophicus]
MLQAFRSERASGTGHAAPPDRLRDHPAFLLFWISRVASALAFQMLGVAVGWLVYARTGSAMALGLVGLAQFLPILLLTLPAGHAADTFDRRRIVVICQAVAAVTLAWLALDLSQGGSSLLAIYGAVMMIGACRAFEHPTMAALLPRLVPGPVLPRAIAVASSALQMATIAGPAVGGFAYALGPTVPLAAAAACYGMAALAMMIMPHAHAPAARGGLSLVTLLEGLSFIRGHKVVLGSISLDLFAVLLGGVTALLPIFASDILHVGAEGLGALRAAPAVGAVLMSVLLARMPLTKHVGPKMFAAVAVFGLATVVFSLSSSFLVSLCALFVLGAADNVSVVIRSSLVQLSTPDAMRGRVSAVNSLFIGTSNQLGEFESGMAAALLGAVGAGVVGGIGTIVVALAWMRLFPDLVTVDRMPARPDRLA